MTIIIKGLGRSTRLIESQHMGLSHRQRTRVSLESTVWETDERRE